MILGIQKKKCYARVAENTYQHNTLSYTHTDRCALILTHARTHARMHARARARAHTHTHVQHTLSAGQCVQDLTYVML